MTREIKPQGKPTRPQRTSFGTRNRLAIHNPDPSYSYRFVNDTEDRVDMFQENGWEVVPLKDVKRPSSRTVDSASALGSASSLSVGQGMKAIVMRIPKDWYEEDQQEKQRRINLSEETMKKEAMTTYNGKISIERD